MQEEESRNHNYHKHTEFIHASNTFCRQVASDECFEHGAPAAAVAEYAFRDAFVIRHYIGHTLLFLIALLLLLASHFAVYTVSYLRQRDTLFHFCSLHSIAFRDRDMN